MNMPLWDIPTHWYIIPQASTSTITPIPYRSWSDFMDSKPYHEWHQVTIISWSWRNTMFQIIFTTRLNDLTGMTYIEFPVKREDEPQIREWIKKQIPECWKI